MRNHNHLSSSDSDDDYRRESMGSSQHPSAMSSFIPKKSSDFTFFPSSRSELVKNIEIIKKPEDLLMIGSLVPLAKKLDSPNSAQSALQSLEKLTKEQAAAVCLLIPLYLAPYNIYDAIFGIFSEIKNFPKIIQTGILMKMAKAAIASERGVELYQTEIFQTNQKENPDLYTAPLLYLCAALNKPIKLDMQYSGLCRVNAETIYYIGVNELLLKDYESAERDFIRALVLSKKNKDMKSAIYGKLSLASFLNKTSFKVFISYIPVQNSRKGIIFDIWETEKPINTKALGAFYQKFENEIVAEHARRVILELSYFVTEMKYEEVLKLCGSANVDAILQEMSENNSLISEVVDDIIHFYDSTKTVIIVKELNTVTASLELSKASISE